MTSFLDKLNLRPQERRLVVIIGLVVFFVVNLWLVWPHYGDWGRLKNRTGLLEDTLRNYQREIERTPQYRKELAELERQGASVASEDQALSLSKTVYAQASLSGVQVNRYDPTPRTTGRTNAFFDEQSGVITITTDERSLVDFLYNLGAGNSLIRVRSMTLNPDVPARMKLSGTLTLVASYQRTPMVRASAPAATAPALATARTNPVAGPPDAARRSALPFARTNITTTGTNRPAAAPVPAPKPSLWARFTSLFSRKPEPAITNTTPRPATTATKTNVPPRAK